MGCCNWNYALRNSLGMCSLSSTQVAFITSERSRQRCACVGVRGHILKLCVLYIIQMLRATTSVHFSERHAHTHLMNNNYSAAWHPCHPLTLALCGMQFVRSAVCHLYAQIIMTEIAAHKQQTCAGQMHHSLPCMCSQFPKRCVHTLESVERFGGVLTVRTRLIPVSLRAYMCVLCAACVFGRGERDKEKRRQSFLWRQPLISVPLCTCVCM